LPRPPAKDGPGVNPGRERRKGIDVKDIALMIAVRRVDGFAGERPRPASPGSAGLDLAAHLAEPVTIPAGGRRLIPTGIAVAIPPGFEGQVRPRSGLALKHGVTLLNSPGTIDSDYRGQIQVIMVNLGEGEFEVRPGDRIAQLVVAPVAAVEWEVVDALPGTGRGEGGFGHSGT
jgi:dUTP pyrophosphatase